MRWAHTLNAHAHPTDKHSHHPSKALPPNEDTVASSSISSVLKSSWLPTPAKGGEVTGGASGSRGPRGAPWGESGKQLLFSDACGL